MIGQEIHESLVVHCMHKNGKLVICMHQKKQDQNNDRVLVKSPTAIQNKLHRQCNNIAHSEWKRFAHNE